MIISFLSRKNRNDLKNLRPNLENKTILYKFKTPDLNLQPSNMFSFEIAIVDFISNQQGSTQWPSEDRIWKG